MLNKKLAAFTLAMITAHGLFADNVNIVGTINQTLNQSSPSAAASSSSVKQKVIQLLKVELSQEEKMLLARRAQELTASPQLKLRALHSATLMETKKQLGMNNVPVLDQGVHGTCVTFAVTAAVDAVLAKGDYISQLCNLQLGTYLEKHGYGYSGWEGSFASHVINQMEQFGIVTKEKQLQMGCGGMTYYPTYWWHDDDSFIEPDQYRQMSELIFGNRVNWFDVYHHGDAEQTLAEVKQTLNAGHRMVFATLLPSSDLGTAGAVGRYKTWIYRDSWVLTPEVLAGVPNVKAAHEMIITGYDDDAIAVDNHGVEHKGLLSLRNSWGTTVGDYGEFYMSYDYFKLLAYDLTKLTPSTI